MDMLYPMTEAEEKRFSKIVEELLLLNERRRVLENTIKRVSIDNYNELEEIKSQIFKLEKERRTTSNEIINTANPRYDGGPKLFFPITASQEERFHQIDNSLLDLRSRKLVLTELINDDSNNHRAELDRLICMINEYTVEYTSIYKAHSMDSACMNRMMYVDFLHAAREPQPLWKL